MIPVSNSITERPESQVDYKAMWLKLCSNMQELQAKDVGLHAAIVLGYMDFLLQAEQQKER